MSAASRLSSTTSTRSERHARPRRLRPAPRSAAGADAASAIGRRIRKVLPWPTPGLSTVELPAVLLDQRPGQRQADAQARIRPCRWPGAPG